MLVAQWLGGAAFPSLAYRLRWPTRVGPGGFAAYVALRTAFLFGVFQYVFPHIRRTLAEKERLEVELGRQPTTEELGRRLGWQIPED